MALTPGDAATASSEAKNFSTPLPNGSLRRVILIDCYNVMHAFSHVITGLRHELDNRMNPMILVPLVLNLIREGWTVRLVTKTMPDPKNLTDLYILEAFERAGICSFPKTIKAEQDDLLMLRYARQYGAVIISNDKFKNHDEYEYEAKYYTIKYKAIQQDFHPNMLKKTLIFEKIISLSADMEMFYASEDDEDFERVQLSHKKFPRPDDSQRECLMVLELYVLSIIQHGFDLPINFVPFWNDIRQDFPMLFDEFYDAYIEYKTKKTFEHVSINKVPSDFDDDSDDDY